MNWADKCILDLTHHNLFENDSHRGRFRDLLCCYQASPFFTKGLCKCMYVSAWDEEHFDLLLEMLNAVTIERDERLGIMKDQGSFMTNEYENSDNMHDRAQGEIWRMSSAFLSGEHYEPKDLGLLEVEEPETAYIIKQSVKAAMLIDELPPLPADR